MEHIKQPKFVNRKRCERTAINLKVWFTLATVAIVATGIGLLVGGLVHKHNDVWPAGIALLGTGLIMIIFSLIFIFGIRIREYKYKDLNIWVYSGFIDHMLVVNDEMVDGVRVLIHLDDHEDLETNYKGKYKIEARVNLFGVTLKVNGQMLYYMRDKWKRQLAKENKKEV